MLPLQHDLIGKDKALVEMLQQVHAALNLGLFGLLLAHVGATIKHHFVNRDDILPRKSGRTRRWVMDELTAINAETLIARVLAYLESVRFQM